jgi:hypothetical protein
MDSAGITPEEDLQDAPEEIIQGEGDLEVGEERLSIFEDFLDQLDIEKSEDDEEEMDDND